MVGIYLGLYIEGGLRSLSCKSAFAAERGSFPWTCIRLLLPLFPPVAP